MLLDTHALLWFVLNDPRLTATARAAIVDPANDVLVSPATYWEIAIKISTQKYSISEPYETFMNRAIQGNNLEILPIEPRHTAPLTTLPYHHRDPFDWFLIAQAIVEGVPVVGADSVFDLYPIQRMW
jgi:PIN domain nuclease of toxin-antitoxin system